MAHIAACAHHWHILEFLLSTSFDFELEDRWGYTVAKEMEEDAHGNPELLEKIKSRMTQKSE